MKKQIVLFILILLALIFSITVNAFDSTSFRMKSIGIELKWIVDDEYTDILHNPASITTLGSNWLLTNLSNQSGNSHQFLNYGENLYQNYSGSYLFGGFYQLSNWNIGIIGDYWKNKSWYSKGYQMSTDFSDNYSFSWQNTVNNDEGTWITDYNNNSETLYDDWRVSEEKHGTNYLSDDFGIDLLLIFGKQNFGFSYRLVRSTSNSPIDNLQNAYHSYNLMEVGLNSPMESVFATQQEICEYNNQITQHFITYGISKKINEKSNLDIVGSLSFSITDDNSESRKEKQIDFDPDNDYQSFETGWNIENYNLYNYQSLETFLGDNLGMGFRFDGKYSKQINEKVQIKVIGKLHYQLLVKDDYRSQTKTNETMTAFVYSSSFSNSSDIKISGSQKRNSFSSLLGIGGVVNPQSNLLIGFGLKWYYNFSETIYDLTDYYSGISQNDEDFVYYNRIALPIGFEYLLKEKYAFRLGVNTNFSSIKKTKSYLGYEESNSYSQDSDVSSTTFGIYNTTHYSYGIGYKMTDNINIDITGITNLTDISNLFLSFIYTFN